MTTYPSLELARESQRVMIDVLRRERTWLDTDDMGLGKTRTGLLAPPAAWGILVICPAGVCGIERVPGKPVGGWLAEAARVRPDLRRTRLEGDATAILAPEAVTELEAKLSSADPKERERIRGRLAANRRRLATRFRWPEPGELCVASYETARTAPPLGVPPHPVAVMIDEAQAIKNRKSQQSQRVARVVADALAGGGTAWAFTGTPLTKNPEDLETILGIFHLFQRAFPGGAADFGRVFRRELKTRVFGRPRCQVCNAVVDEPAIAHCGKLVRKPKTVRSWEYGEPGPEAAERLRRVSLGRMLEDVTDLPAVVEVEHAAALDAKALQALEAVGRLSDEELARAIERERVASDPDSHVARARAALAGAKRAIVGDVLDEITSAGERVVFFADHRDPVLEIVEARERWGAVLGSKAFVHGENDTRREYVIDRFARGELDGIALTLGAGGTGVDGLQRAARHLVLLEESWSPSLVAQAVARLRRLGQAGTVVLHRLVTGHEVEERVHAVVERKLAFLKVVDDARRAPAEPPLGAW